MALLISILTFTVVALAFVMIWLFFGSGTTQEVVRRRFESVRKAERRGGDKSLAVDLLRDEMLSSIPTVHRILLQWSWPGRLRESLRQAGLRMKPGKLLLICGVSAVAADLIAGQFFLRFPIALLIGVAAGFVPIGIVVLMRKRRLRKFEEHFPEALDLLGRAVRAGHAFTTGLEMIAKESAEPIAVMIPSPTRAMIVSSVAPPIS